MSIKKILLGLGSAAALGYAGWQFLKPGENGENGDNGEPPIGTATLYGTVLDESGDVPLPGVEVSVAPSAGGVKQATTDQYGEYIITDLPLGLCVVSFTKANYGTEVVTGVNLLDGGNLIDVVMSTGTGTATLWGYVLNADTGDTIPGIRVDYPGGMMFSGADGKYQFDDIWHRISAELVAEDTNYPVAKRYEDYSELVSTIAGESTQHDIYMEPVPTNGPPSPTKATVYGIVIDRYSGDGIPGVTVSVDGYNTTTDGNGEYLIEEIEPGDYTAIFSMAGYETRSYSVGLVEGGEYPLGVVLTELGVGTATLHGIVRDQDGTPIEGVYVDVGSYPPAHQTITDDFGNYSVSGIVPGTYWLTFTARVSGYSGATKIEKTLVSGDNSQDADIVLTPVPTQPTPLTVCRLAIDYFTPGGYLIGDYGSDIYRSGAYLGGIICPLSLPYNTPIVGYWTAPEEANIPAPVVTRPNGSVETLGVFAEIVTSVGIRRRYGPLLTNEVGTYQIDYMGEETYWHVDPWAEIESFTYVDGYLTKTYYATINILREWSSTWVLGTGMKVQDRVNIGQLGVGPHTFDWTRVFNRAEEPMYIGAPYLLLSRQNVPNAFYDGSEQCAMVLNRGVISVPQLIGVAAAYKSG